jgi:hypothetical protein
VSNITVVISLQRIAAAITVESGKFSSTEALCRRGSIGPMHSVERMWRFSIASSISTHVDGRESCRGPSRASFLAAAARISARIARSVAQRADAALRCAQRRLADEMSSAVRAITRSAWGALVDHGSVTVA